MDFVATTDQLSLVTAVRTVLTREFDRHKLAATTGGFDPVIWDHLRDTGVFALTAPIADGGLGLGMTELSLVTQELGKACVPGPVVATLVAGTLHDSSLRTSEDPVTLVDVNADPLLVTHVDSSAWGLVLSDSKAGIIDIDAVSAAARRLGEEVDPHTPVWKLALADLHLQDLAHDAGPIRDRGAVLAAAFQTGIAMRCTELAVAYAKERQQFGKPIGSFQAVKHICADMLARAEVARASVDAAATTLDGRGSGEPSRAVSSAKMLADDAAVRNARTCIQVYGGMGFTWEVEVHYYLKRAWVLATEWGSADDHAESLATAL